MCTLHAGRPVGERVRKHCGLREESGLRLRAIRASCTAKIVKCLRTERKASGVTLYP